MIESNRQFNIFHFLVTVERCEFCSFFSTSENTSLEILDLCVGKYDDGVEEGYESMYRIYVTAI